MSIRAATLADVPRLVAMGQAFCAASPYGALWPEDVDAMDRVLTRLVAGPASVVLVADREAHVVGMIGLHVYAHPVTGLWTAGELMWWVEPDARGGGLALLRAGERWAVDAGAEQIQMVAPSGTEGARVGALYARRGYRAIETTYARAVTAAQTAIRVVDDVLPAFDAYRAAACAQPFGDFETAPGYVFHGVAPVPDDTLAQAITARYPTLTPLLSALRRSPAGQVEPHFIHADCDMGEWTAILYLTRAPVAEDGTTFWRSRATGAIQSTATTIEAFDAERAAWADRDQWVPWHTVAARPNRLVIFPAAYYHARAIEGNVGNGDDARLIQLVFGRGAFPPQGA